MVKLYIDYKPNQTGKGKFLSRLVPELEKLGVKCKFKRKGCDVALGLTWWKDRLPKMPRILRMDGIYLENNARSEWYNKVIRRDIKRTHAVIWQSKFCRRKIKKILSVQPRKEFVIYNGAPLKEFEGIEKNEYAFNYLTVAKWLRANGSERKHKGGKETAKLAKRVVNSVEDTCFYIVGKCKKRVKHPRIKYLGTLKEKELNYYYRLANTFVYMAEYDWCPNAVVDAKVAGIPILHNKKCKALKEIVKAPQHDFLIENVARKYKKVIDYVMQKKA